MGETLKLYLDQMIPSEVARALREQGHDVLRASEIGQNRADDLQILEKAISENRILITLDEHFGDWVVLPLSRHPGVIRLKVTPTTTDKISNLLLSVLESSHPGTIQGSHGNTFGKACQMDSHSITRAVAKLFIQYCRKRVLQWPSMAKINFDPQSPVLAIDITLESEGGIKRRIRVALDTGATYTMIPWEIAEALGYKPEMSKEKVTLCDIL